MSFPQELEGCGRSTWFPDAFRFPWYCLGHHAVQMQAWGRSCWNSFATVADITLMLQNWKSTCHDRFLLLYSCCFYFPLFVLMIEAFSGFTSFFHCSFFSLFFFTFYLALAEINGYSPRSLCYGRNKEQVLRTGLHWRRWLSSWESNYFPLLEIMKPITMQRKRGNRF